MFSSEIWKILVHLFFLTLVLRVPIIVQLWAFCFFFVSLSQFALILWYQGLITSKTLRIGNSPNVKAFKIILLFRSKFDDQNSITKSKSLQEILPDSRALSCQIDYPIIHIVSTQNDTYAKLNQNKKRQWKHSIVLYIKTYIKNVGIQLSKKFSKNYF